MNQASRLHNFVGKIQAHKAGNVKLQDVYFEVLDVDNVYDMYSALYVLQQQVQIMKNIFIQSNKLEKYSDFLSLLTKLIAPDSIVQGISALTNVVNHVEPRLMVLADAFEITDFEEEDISEDLDDIKLDLDAFLHKIKTLDIDNSSKILYANITYKLKLSIEHYELGGVSGLAEQLRVFKCIASDEEASKTVIDRLSSVIDKAQQTKDIAGFMIDNISDVIGLLGR